MNGLPLRLIKPLAMAGMAGISPAGAAILAYDGFDTSQYVAGGSWAAPVYGNPASSNALIYDPDVTVNNANHTAQNPPTHGFSGEWRHLDSINNSIHAKVLTSTLTYSGMEQKAGALSIGRTSGSAGLKRFERSLSVGNSTGYGNTLYLAGLVQPTAGTAFSIRFSYSDGRYIDLTVDGAGLTSLFGSGTSDPASTGTPGWVANAANLFVLKLENAALSDPSEMFIGDQVSLYLNPDLGSEGANTPVLQYGTELTNFFVTGNAGFSLSNMRLSATPDVGQSVVFDELKIATSWEDLSQTVTIPEPSAALLMLLGGLLPFRRKR